MPLAMKTSHYIFFILAAGISLSGCDDKECIKKDCITGTYIMDVKVIKRVPIISYDFGRPDVIPFDHQIIHDEVMDTTQNVCCLLTIKDSCYDSYSITGEGIKIIEIDDILYLKNAEYFDTNGERITHDIPLITQGDSLVFEKKNNPSIGYFARLPESVSSANNWPGASDLLYFSIQNKSNKTIYGKWVLKDWIKDHCRITMSDDKEYPYRMGEFAEFTLTKVE